MDATAVMTKSNKPILKPTETTLHQRGDASMSSAGAASSPQGKTEEEKRHLTWDEHAIEEHDLLRGTRMKIDEPDTPYTHYDHSDGEESATSDRHHPRSPDETHPTHNAQTNSLATQWGDISSKLQAVADKREAEPTLSPAPSWKDDNNDGSGGSGSCNTANIHNNNSMSDNDGNSEDEEARKRKDQHEKKFRDMRKKHYNEAEAMRRWKAEHANDDDEDDDDDDDDDDKMET